MGKTIMLVCSAGMSTSILVKKMLEAADKKNIDTEIFAVSSSEADDKISEKQIDVLLLGPQVRFLENDFKNRYADQNIPIAVIGMADYGMMNGEKVLQYALELIGE